MKTDISQALVDEHRLILRMIALLERNAARTAAGNYANWQFYLDGVDFIRKYADRFHHAKEEDVLFEAMIETACRGEQPGGSHADGTRSGASYVREMEAAVREA